MAKITINLKSQTLKAIQNFANESNQLLDRVIEDAIVDSLDPGYENNLDEILIKARELQNKYNKITASLLQRELSIGYARAIRIMHTIKPTH